MNVRPVGSIAPEDENTCYYCVHYRQHYNEDGHSVKAGHCGQPKLHDLKPDSKPCKYFRRTKHPPLEWVGEIRDKNPGYYGMQAERWRQQKKMEEISAAWDEYKAARKAERG